ncbi:MAG: TrmH family RNA methyltransferase [Bacilli bacterium]|jgi:TrmH family RNA methyltransferase|nr:RNA methyltransferase [Bacilli bacterium]
MLITSLDNAKVKHWWKLNQKRYRHQQKQFLVEGMHGVLEACKCNRVLDLILEQDVIFPTQLNPIYVTKDIIKKISNLTSPPDVMAVCAIKDEEELIGSKYLLLDGIQDPINLGVIIRSAVAFNIDTIVLGANTVDCYNPKVVRATQGMLFHLNIIRQDLLNVIPILKQKGISVIGTKVTHGEDIRNLNLKDNYALVVGNEGSGVSDETLALCDDIIYIDMSAKCESLNVGVAASIILYELNKRS